MFPEHGYVGLDPLRKLPGQTHVLCEYRAKPGSTKVPQEHPKFQRAESTAELNAPSPGDTRGSTG